MLAKFTLAILALAGAAFASVSNGGLSILVPGGPNLWWLAGQQNNLIWTCGQSTFTTFEIWINNSDVTLLTAITPLLSIEQNFNCEQGISPDLIAAVPVGTGYTIVLADPANSTNVYAVSDQFEVKPLASGYPASSATPTQATQTVSKGTASNVISQTGSSSGSGSAPAKTGGALSLRPAALTAGALVGAAVAMAALL